MKIIYPALLKIEADEKNSIPNRDFLLDKTIAFKLLKESFFIDLKIGRELRFEESRLGISPGRRKFNTAMIFMFGVLSLYMVLGSIIFTLYTIKSRAGLDIFPNIHFFQF